MDLSAFELTKHNERTNTISRIHETPIVKYGRIIKVIDIQTVVVEGVVRVSLDREIYTVTLLSLSSALMETNVWPKVGDTVLLLFLQRHDPRMFCDGMVENADATGYNHFSGVGILMSTVKDMASTSIHYRENENGPFIGIKSGALVSGTFTSNVALLFCQAVAESGDEALISLVFGDKRPLQITLREESDITVESKSGLITSFEEDISVKTEKKLAIEGGDGVEVDAADGKVAIKNSQESLGDLICQFIDALDDMGNTGMASSYPFVITATQTTLKQIKTKIKNLMET